MKKAMARNINTTQTGLCNRHRAILKASSVKKMEELGIVRHRLCLNSGILRDRSYGDMDRRRFVPEDRGRLVTTFSQILYAIC